MRPIPLAYRSLVLLASAVLFAIVGVASVVSLTAAAPTWKEVVGPGDFASWLLQPWLAPLLAGVVVTGGIAWWSVASRLGRLSRLLLAPRAVAPVETAGRA